MDKEHVTKATPKAFSEPETSAADAIQEIHICDYMARRRPEDVIVDIRDKTMFDFGTLPGAVNIPISSLSQLYQLPKERDIYVFCQADEVSRPIVELLTDAGYHAWNLSGGYREYLKAKIAAEAEETQHTGK